MTDLPTFRHRALEKLCGVLLRSIAFIDISRRGRLDHWSFGLEKLVRYLCRNLASFTAEFFMWNLRVLRRFSNVTFERSTNFKAWTWFLAFPLRVLSNNILTTGWTSASVPRSLQSSPLAKDAYTISRLVVSFSPCLVNNDKDGYMSRYRQLYMIRDIESLLYSSYSIGISEADQIGYVGI